MTNKTEHTKKVVFTPPPPRVRLSRLNPSLTPSNKDSEYPVYGVSNIRSDEKSDFGLGVSGLKMCLDENNKKIDLLSSVLKQGLNSQSELIGVLRNSKQVFKHTNKRLISVLWRLERARRRQWITIVLLIAIIIVLIFFFVLSVWLIDYVIRNDVLNHIVAAIAA